ncbi:MAG TPA: TonB-dependent receptor [Chitinophagaceae bacterium]|jgi:iron complex outermembrane recepter protein|nr:TonB-dependent receptor [Chitinophagaceae bacterium]
MKNWICGAFLLISGIARSQDSKEFPDSADRKLLQEVVVQAYEQNRRLSEVPVAVGVITKAEWNRYNNLSIVPAMNSIPGVRMEERSPGSYRLSFRGSTLRSPFGVRNVKVYLDGIPFTDPGGNTYLTQLAPSDMYSMEVIKGPAGSLYGAATGGALLIKSRPDTWQPGFSADYSHGTFNSNTINAQVRLGNENGGNIINYSHQTSDGYRDHTNLRRDIVTWESMLKNDDRHTLSTYAFYGDLYYQTPGALNLSEYNANPKQSRPAFGPFPSADQSQAAVYQKTFMAAITNTERFNSKFQNTTNFYTAYTNYTNPTFRNYEFRSEPHFGGRTDFNYTTDLLHLSFGGEAQKGFFQTQDYGNVNGAPDTLQTSDNINTWTYTLFAQADLFFGEGWQASFGLSYNESFIGIHRVSDPGSLPRNKTFSNELAPRFAISKKITPDILAYASISKGFSPPTVSEVLPSTGSINTDLQPENGISYEAGLKSSFFNRRLYLEVIGFYFELQQAIVVRKDSSNADYYTNAGSTTQKGIESQLSYQLLPSAMGLVSSARIWTSYTLDHFTYGDFKKDNTSYDGNHLPGVANNTFTGGVDLNSRPGIFLHLTYYYSDKMPLNDANTAYAASYQLLGGRIGYATTVKKLNVSFYTGVDNALNAKYSLGNDINAAGGRYYNAAPTANYFAGISINYNKPVKK